MESSAKGVRIGLVGVAFLLISYIRLFGFRFMSPGWSIAILILSALAVVAFVAAGADKTAMMKRVWAGEAALPSAHVTSVGELVWFIDKAAHGEA